MATVVLTGGTSGVGLGVGRALLDRGERVVVLARSTERARAALDGAHVIRCDLASLSSVDEAVEDVLRGGRIDALIACAGVAPWKRQESADGHELTFATNVLGHAHLVAGLRARIVESAPARIVTISGRAHRRGTIHWHDLQLCDGYSPLRAATQAALAKVMWTFWLARQLRNARVSANTFCPGYVRSALTRDFPRWAKPFVRFSQRFARSQEDGARTPVWLATDRRLEGTTGAYFRDGARREASPRSYDESLQARLMERIDTMRARKRSRA